MNENIDIRPVLVDRLVEFQAEELTSRRARIEVLLAQYQTRCEGLRAQLVQVESVHKFLTQEHEGVVLAQRLQSGDVVRIICPQCKGTGLKPTDITSGQLHRKSAFETVGDNARPVPVVPTEVDVKDRCVACGGNRYQLMERYRG